MLEKPGAQSIYCMKSVQIRCFFWSVFSRIWTQRDLTQRKILNRNIEKTNKIKLQMNEREMSLQQALVLLHLHLSYF